MTSTPTKPQNGHHWKMVFDIASRAIFMIVTLFIGLVAFEGKSLISSIQDHERRLVRIEANRYTAGDAVKDMRQLNESINALRNWIEERYPPQWLKEDVAELKADIRELRAIIVKHDAEGNKENQ